MIEMSKKELSGNRWLHDYQSSVNTCHMPDGKCYAEKRINIFNTRKGESLIFYPNFSLRSNRFGTFQLKNSYKFEYRLRIMMQLYHQP